MEITDNSIKDLQNKTRVFRKWRILLKEKMEKCIEKANTDKEAAQYELNRKNLLEEQYNKLLAAECSIETQIMSLESTTTTLQTNHLKKTKVT